MRSEWRKGPLGSFVTLQHGRVLTPGRYVGPEEVEDYGEPFAEKYPRLVAEMEESFVDGRVIEDRARLALGAIADEN